MAKPLFSPEEQKAWKDKFDVLDAAHRKDNTPFDHYWAQREAIARAERIDTNRRVRARANEYLDALITLVGSRGSSYVNFPHCFNESDSLDVRQAIEKHDTPETRRALHTILRAFSEVPKSWARSAFVRFLRGNGKQKEAKYHGAGMFGLDYGWKGEEVTAVCAVIADETSPYSQALVTYANVEKEIREADPDYQVTSYDVRFKAVRAERDVEFLTALCSMLEKRGLAPIPKPKERKPKKTRVPKQFVPGDVVTLRNMRDVPLPAHVRIPIEKFDEPSKQWLPSTIEHVVVRLGNAGNYYRYVVTPKGEAFEAGMGWEGKYWLDGATYLGPWKGKLNKHQDLTIRFRYRKPEKKNS
ncbi:MAG TPA: hypothetical protein VFT82_02145 [Candidatus Paceibacterota bacterium]|nr:hypothetical protein [Candidatus Paceibacterota bacterium]